MSPRDPPPKIRFEEFDGLNRIIFSRRNKHVRACFGAKGVKEMLEGNYKTWCAETGKVRSAVSTRAASFLEPSVHATLRTRSLTLCFIIEPADGGRRHGL
jgi:16S rRNA A1518/A1519 N6-dimethyltransferase RsmA/KsgA/DIM1 with predicted DNA glycosylase/AP lyase activity